MSTVDHVLSWLAIFAITWLVWDFLRAATRACDALAKFFSADVHNINYHQKLIVTDERGNQ